MSVAAYALLSPPPAGESAIALIGLRGDIDQALRRLGIRDVQVGGVALRDLCGVDTGLVARWSERSCTLMPHAGPAVVAELLAKLAAAGLPVAEHPDLNAGDWRDQYPQAGSLLEARALYALARAASPLAVDALLAQVDRWAAAVGVGASELDSLEARQRVDAIASDPAVLQRSGVLMRLIEPPLVAVIGRPNIGKSSLLNALAGRSVAIVADLPGTTRDHVGATIELDGLVVRWLDLPGLAEGQADTQVNGEEAVLAEAQRAGIAAARAADLLLSCSDATTPPLDVSAMQLAAPVVHIALRADLGESSRPGERADVSISMRTGQGLTNLVTRVREALVPASVLHDRGPWRFW